MHEHDLRTVRRQGFEAGTHRGLPRLAAKGCWKQIQSRRSALIKGRIVGMNDRLNPMDIPVAGK
jgi:hypothetical protein